MEAVMNFASGYMKELSTGSFLINGITTPYKICTKKWGSCYLWNPHNIDQLKVIEEETAKKVYNLDFMILL